MATEVMNEN